MLKAGVIRFLGTNCDADVKKWITESGKANADYLWSEDQFNINEYDFLVVPGGFSYGDYLRAGALAAHTSVMKSVREFAAKGKPILGICNGFQILCEAGLLPGVLLQNNSLRFKDHWVNISVNIETNNQLPLFRDMKKGQLLKLPIAHGDGRYYADAETLKKLVDQNLIWLSYTDNPNGSLANIAGVTNEQKNIFGLMPHPERALASWMGSQDGVFFL